MVVDPTLGLGAGGAVVVGAIVAGVGLYMPGIPKKAGRVIAALGVIFAFLGGAMLLGLLSAAPPAQATETALYDITYTESEDHQSYDQDDRTITVAVSFNDTADAFVSDSGNITGVFTLTRTDAMITNAVALGQLGSFGMVDVTGASPEPIIVENADDSMAFYWIKASGVEVTEDVSILVESGDSANVTLHIHLNADAVAEMAQYESKDISFTLGGQVFTIEVIKATVST